jgi:hypothetical protein
MYLFVRRAVIRGLDAQKWAIDIGAAASEGLDARVDVWSSVLSPDVGNTTWTTMWPDLSSLENSLASLLSNPKYLALVAEGPQFIGGAIDDVLFQIVYPGAGPTVDARYAGSVTAVCAPGNFSRGMLGGLEIAQRVEQTTGVSTGFLVRQTGPYGGVTWLAGYESIEAYETAQQKLAADTGFPEFIDQRTTAYVADPSTTQATLYMKIG